MAISIANSFSAGNGKGKWEHFEKGTQGLQATCDRADKLKPRFFLMAFEKKHVKCHKIIKS